MVSSFEDLNLPTGGILMTYVLFQPPSFTPFHMMERKEAVAYFEWFIEQISHRVHILEQIVRSSDNYQNWPADCSVASLDTLSKWFLKFSENRPRTQDEIERARREIPDGLHSIEVREWTLTDMTVSLAMDIGIYMGQVLIANHTNLSWELLTKPKNSIDYQQPVIAGFPKRKYSNPVSGVLAQARFFADKTAPSSHLVEIYDRLTDNRWNVV